MSRWKLWWWIVGAVGFESAAQGQEGTRPYLVMDIHGGEARIDGGWIIGEWNVQSDLTAVDGKLYFAAPTHAEREYLYCSKGICKGEPWVSDGTPEGTLVLAEIAPGPWGSQASGFTGCGDRVVFQATEDPSRRPLSTWITDGTPGGTRPATESDLLPGCTTDPRPRAGGRFVYPWYDGAHGTELWVSDGDPEEGRLLKDIYPGPISGSPEWLTFFDGRVFFVASDPMHGRELWVSDGTPEGTALFLDLIPGEEGSSPGWLARAGTRLFFQGWGSPLLGGLAVWASDGTESGTSVIWETDPRESSYSEPQWVTAAGDRIFFAARPCCDEVVRFQLWTSDGTAGGTFPITGIAPGLGEHRDYMPELRFAAIGERYYCIAPAGIFGTPGLALWATDLTPEGTSMIKDLSGPASSRPERLVAFRDKVIFSAEDADHGRELWVSDGSPAGTALLADIYPGMEGFITSAFSVVWDGRVYFTDGTFLGVSEGTPQTTRVVSRALSCADGGLTLFGGRLFFSACDELRGRELWTSDGTEAGTKILKDIVPGPESSSPWQLRVACEKLFFLAGSFAGGGNQSLWVTDGTPEGTVPWAGDICEEGTELHLLARYDPEHGEEPWVSDGTESGTRLFLDLVPGPESSSPAGFVKAGDRFYFSALHPEHGRELWISDGTPDGTRLAFDILPGQASSDPQELAVAGDRLFFSAHDPVHGRELWVLPLAGPGPDLFHRADPNGSGTTDISDAIAIFGHLFLGDPEALACRESADVQNDAAIDLSDGIALLNWLFAGGPPPAPPGPAAASCGVDPDAAGSTGDLGCGEYTQCR